MAKKDVADIVSGAGWIAGFADKLIRGLHEQGVSDEKIHSLVTDEGGLAMDEIVAAVARKFKPFVRDMVQEGWTLLENTTKPIVSIDKLEPVPFLKDSESYVGGEEMARRSLELHANLGQHQAEYMLEHQADIPEEFRQYVLVFPGTIWRNRDGLRNVPCLGWDGERWYLDFGWLRGSFDSDCRLLRSRESS